MSMDKALIGQRIRAARNLRGMKAAVLAEQIEITTESLGHIECGVRGPSLQTLIRISDVLEVSLDYLVGKTRHLSIMPCTCLPKKNNLPHKERLL